MATNLKTVTTCSGAGAGSRTAAEEESEKSETGLVRTVHAVAVPTFNEFRAEKEALGLSRRVKEDRVTIGRSRRKGLESCSYCSRAPINIKVKFQTKELSFQVTVQEVANHSFFESATLCHAARLIDKHGKLVVMKGVLELTNRLREVGRKKTTIKVADPIALVEHFLESRSFISQTPVIRKFIDCKGLLIPQFAWVDKIEGLTPLNEHGIYCSSPILKVEHEAHAKMPVDTEEQANILFAHFKSYVPHKYTKDGCDVRCLWIAAMLQDVMKIDYVSKVKVWSKDGRTPLAALGDFPKGENWLMHTAPVVEVGGKKYVFDMSLPAPILFEEWLSALHPNPDEILVSVSDRWENPCLSSAGEAPYTESLSRVMDDLRGMYLFETVDGVDTAKSWTDWVEEERGFAPVGPVIALEDRECDVIVSAAVKDGSLIRKIKKMKLRESFIPLGNGLYCINERTAQILSLGAVDSEKAV